MTCSAPLCLPQQVSADGCPEPRQVANLLQQVLAGDLVPRYGAKGHKGGEPSADPSRRGSVDLSQNQSGSGRRASINLNSAEAGVAGRRRSVDYGQGGGNSAGAGDMSENRRRSVDFSGQGGGGAAGRRSIMGDLSGGVGSMSIGSSGSSYGDGDMGGARRSVNLGQLEVSQNNRRSMDGYSPMRWVVTHSMICHSKNAIGFTHQAVTETTKSNNRWSMVSGVW